MSENIPPADQNDSIPPKEDPAFQEAPILPQGDTGIPMWPSTTTVPMVQAVVSDTPVPNVEFLGQLGVLPAEQQKIVMEWFPFVYHTNSVYLEGAQIRTPQQILDHVAGYVAAQQAEVNQRDKVTRVEERAQRIASRQTKDLKGTLWAQWVESCRLRKEWIAGKKAELEKRKAEREKVQAAWQEQMDKALREWNEYVNAAHVEYITAKGTPPPPRP